MVHEGRSTDGKPFGWEPRRGNLTVTEREQILLGIGQGKSLSSMTTPARPYPTIGVAILNQRSSHRRTAGGHSQ